MKLQIKSHSIRFRITAAELQELSSTGRIEGETRIPQDTGLTATLTYGVQVSHDDPPSSQLKLSSSAMKLMLCDTDLKSLLNPDNEGVYIRKEYIGEAGKPLRFLAYVEKDMKPEKIKKHKSGKDHRETGQSTPDSRPFNQAEVNEL